MAELLHWASFAGQELALFLLSMVPLIELRGAVILGAALQMPWPTVLAICIIGNLLPVPFIILFIKRILYLLKRFPLFSGFIHWYEGRLIGHSRKMAGLSFWALALFVGIPLPGTGAWTGAGIAAILNMRLRFAFPAIAIGVVIAGLVMTAGAYGAVGLFQWFVH